MKIMITLFFLLGSALSLQCLDNNGQSVDWWFMFKMPSVVGKFKGYTYLYLDSASSSSSFVVGDIKDASNPLAQTISQLGLYGNSVDPSQVAYVLWNDQTYNNTSSPAVDHEQDPQGNYYAHSKATIGFDANSGFWLAHSAPGFPYSHDICPSSWTFPYRQAYYAQHFFCVSVATPQIETISQFLANYHVYVYDSNVPNQFQSSMPNFVNLVNSQFNLGGSGSLNFKSLAGTPFQGFGKNGATNSDLYEDFVAPGLNTGVTVETWCGGTFGDSCQPSPCQGSPIVDPSTPQSGESTYSFDCIVIEEFRFASDLYFKTSHNHAKFALSYPQGTWVCPADINMQYTQRHRGGGAICFENDNLSKMLTSAVTALNTTCSSNVIFNEVQ